MTIIVRWEVFNMNAGTIIVLTILFAAVILIIRSMVKAKCSGKSPLCGGDCSHCGGYCHQVQDKQVK
jgi:hypothetical protein